MGQSDSFHEKCSQTRILSLGVMTRNHGLGFRPLLHSLSGIRPASTERIETRPTRFVHAWPARHERELFVAETCGQFAGSLKRGTTPPGICLSVRMNLPSANDDRETSLHVPLSLSFSRFIHMYRCILFRRPQRFDTVGTLPDHPVMVPQVHAGPSSSPSRLWSRP